MFSVENGPLQVGVILILLDHNVLESVDAMNWANLEERFNVVMVHSVNLKLKYLQNSIIYIFNTLNQMLPQLLKCACMCVYVYVCVCMCVCVCMQHACLILHCVQLLHWTHLV